jgi:hypothetical protein
MLADAVSVAPLGITVSADKNYDTAGFVASCRANHVAPHVAKTIDVRAAQQLTSELHAGRVKR